MHHYLPSLALAGSALATASSYVDVPMDLPKRVLKTDAYGYSIEPVSVSPYLKSDLMATLMRGIAGIIGQPAPMRMGGNTADQTVFNADLDVAARALPSATNVNTFEISKEWFKGWTEYFPPGTDIIYTLNLRNTTDSWKDAMNEADAAVEVLGQSLTLFELGNEIDHYSSKGWRGPGWDTHSYTPQWKELSDQILSSKFYQNAATHPVFQAAVFADPPWVPDQQDELDDFDIINVTKAGLVDPCIIETYSVHLYPQSTCDPERRSRLSLDLLSNHSVVWTNISQYVPQQAAAEAAGAPLVLGETNSASCSGKSGISDTFGAALWATDYLLTAVSIGIEKVYFHLGHQSEYSAFTPLPYEYEGEHLTSGVRANFYSHLFMAHVLEGSEGDGWSVAALPAANNSDFSGYAVFNGGDAQTLEKLVFVDMGVWNSSHGLHNPSTLSSADSTFVSLGVRPTREFQVKTNWEPGTKVEFVRLQGPGTNAKSDVNVSGSAVDPQTGKLGGQLVPESGWVQAHGIVNCEMNQAEAVLIQKS